MENRLVVARIKVGVLGVTYLKRPRCWERLRAGGEGDDRGWDGWMASPTQWTWVGVDSGSWWWTGRLVLLRFMGSQRVGHDWVTELNFFPPTVISTQSQRPPLQSKVSWFLCYLTLTTKTTPLSSRLFMLCIMLPLNTLYSLFVTGEEVRGGIKHIFFP